MNYYRLLPDGTTEPVPDDAPRLFQSIDERRVAKDAVGEVEVSTVFLAIDHSFGYGPPLLFESMIFGGEYDQWGYRYSTIAEARAGHARILANLTAGRDPDDVAAQLTPEAASPVDDRPTVGTSEVQP